MIDGPPPGRAVVLSLGSNLGDRLANLQHGVDLLCEPDGWLRRATVSGVYETAPVGGPPQGDYLNAVLLGISALACAEILRRCLAAEAALGRVRAERWGPRTLDVDVIVCGDEVRDDPAPAGPAPGGPAPGGPAPGGLALTLPHPRAHERAFVLAPWLEADPAAVLPGRGPVADLLAAARTAGVRRLDGAALTVPSGRAVEGVR